MYCIDPYISYSKKEYLGRGFYRFEKVIFKQDFHNISAGTTAHHFSIDFETGMYTVVFNVHDFPVKMIRGKLSVSFAAP